MQKLLLFNPSVSSLNRGDEIIFDSIKNVLSEIFPQSYDVSISTHLPISRNFMRFIPKDVLKFVCGTNLLSSHLFDFSFRQWDISPFLLKYVKPVILIGTGWRVYENKPDFVSRIAYNKLLNNGYLHSVRDSYTAEKLYSVGVKDILVTGCPTMWNLTKAHCEGIPEHKGDTAIFTITDYRMDSDRDKKLINILSKNYEKIYFWPQGIGDYDYLASLGVNTKMDVIAPTLEAFDKLLDSNMQIDYVGTRLHGGIRALQKKHRSVIIAIDNRAIEINRDFNIPIVKTENLNELNGVINSSFKTEIKLAEEEISKWKDQFKEGE